MLELITALSKLIAIFLSIYCAYKVVKSTGQVKTEYLLWSISSMADVTGRARCYSSILYASLGVYLACK